MTDQQLYLAIGVPSVVALIGILVNIGYFIALNGRINGVEGRITALETKTGLLAENVAVLKSLMDIVLKKLDEMEARIIK